MVPPNGEKEPSNDVKVSAFRIFLTKLKKRHIIETFAGFIAGGWLFLEFVDRILIAHYHLNEKCLDIAFFTVFGALLCVILWRWFSGTEKRPGNVKIEVLLVPLLVLVTLAIDLNLLFQIAGITGNRLLIGVIILCLGIVWIILKLAQWASVPGTGKRDVVIPTPTAARPEKSIVVLPFTNISPEEGQDYFCDGMTEEIITDLSQFPALRVISRNSAMTFKGTQKTTRMIGHELNVQYVLEGSVRKVGNDLRIAAQLIDATNDAHIWAEKYSGKLDDVFAIQEEIALAVANKFRLTLLGEEKARLSKRPTESLEAYKLYLLGRQLRFRESYDDVLKALSYFQQAIERDPKYALAWAGLAEDYFMIDLMSSSPPKYNAQALSAAENALDLEPSLAEGYVALGLVRNIYEWNWAGAEDCYTRAIGLNPNHWNAHREYGLLLHRTGRLKAAIVELEKAIDLEPLAWTSYLLLGRAFCDAESHQLALEYLERAVDLAVSSSFFVWDLPLTLGWEYLNKDSQKKIRQLVPKENLFEQTWFDTLSANINRAQANLAWLEKESFDLIGKLYLLAAAYSMVGEFDKAIFQLERMYATNSMWLCDINIYPYFKRLRSEPRFIALKRKIGLSK